MDTVDREIDGFSVQRLPDALDAGLVTAVFQRIVEMPTGRMFTVTASSGCRTRLPEDLVIRVRQRQR